jgi:hypothetical protein
MFDDNIPPFGEFDDGIKEHVTVEDGDSWSASDFKGYFPSTF